MRLRSGTETLEKPVFPKQHVKEKTDPDQAQTSSSMTEIQGGGGGSQTSQKGRVSPPPPEIQVPGWRDALNPGQVLTVEERNFFLEMKRLEVEAEAKRLEMELKRLELEKNKLDQSGSPNVLLQVLLPIPRNSPYTRNRLRFKEETKDLTGDLNWMAAWRNLHRKRVSPQNIPSIQLTYHSFVKPGLISKFDLCINMF
ncbi:unnamed protein product [Lepidochelys kempii]